MNLISGCFGVGKVIFLYFYFFNYQLFVNYVKLVNL